MKFLAKAGDVTKAESELLVLFAEQGKSPGDLLGAEEMKRVDSALEGQISEIASLEAFEGTAGNTLLLTTHGAIGSRRVLAVGTGKLDELTMSDWQAVAAGVARKAKSVRAARVSVSLPQNLLEAFGAASTVQGFVEGFTLGAYVFLKHKSADTQKKNHEVGEVQLLVSPPKLNAVASGIATGEVVSRAVMFARDLVNEPPSVTTPTHLGEVAKRLADKHPEISCEVLGVSELKKLGMGGLLGIAQGSDEEPKFIKLSYKSTQSGGRKTIALVGKGITFDTGGLSLKPPSGMETMKLDMAGAAAVLGVFSVLAEAKPNVQVVGLISATENMPSGKAVKPGDVVRIMNGKTVEILNTDAEGRMVLSDALSYAVEKVKPDAIVDLATLTGACMVALGEDVAGMFANNTALAERLKDAAKKSGELIWELPLAKEYKPALKSTVADIKNISSSRYGGAINGALFLQEFVPDSVPWAHLDIAGPAFAEKDAPLTPLGGTGFGVRLLLAYLLSA